MDNYRSWGYLDDLGNLNGLEINLTWDIGKRLDVEVELIPVVTKNRISFLRKEKIDLIIANLSDHPNQHKIVGIILSHYYSKEKNFLAKKTNNLNNEII